MSKTISPALKTHLSSEATTLCVCLELHRRDGQVFYFADLDEDLVIDGHTYVASAGFSRSAMTANTDFSIDNISIMGVLDSETLTEADIRAGLFDYAEMRMFMVNWADLTMGILRIRRGILGDVSVSPSGQFQTVMNGLGQVLNHIVGETYTGLCTADLGDARCGVDLVSAGFLKDATVTTVGDNQTFTITVDEPRAVDGWFVDGVVTWQTGLNSGRSMEVKTWTTASSTVALFLPMPRAIVIGDTMTIYAGCDKRPITCRDKFNNIVNNRSFPFIPGMDKMIKNPQRLL